MVPCITPESLQLLLGTADERYASSPEYFRNTHSPQALHQFFKDTTTIRWTEQDFFQELTKEPPRNNRVFAILGSTGAGKSELLCWVRDQWNLLEIKRPVIRISRTELNPQLLIEKCCRVLQIDLNVTLDGSRWDTLLQKPVTIVNQIIWSSLSELYAQDDDIVPLALLFRPIIEENLVRFTTSLKKQEINEQLELISFEQYKRLLDSTSLPMSVDYDLFHQTLIGHFDRFLFHGQDIITLMKRLSAHLIERKIRPLLLIDDLVQSINIYAAELLDLFLTLEEGNWDVVIGMTPGAIRSTKRDGELINRFLNLDTIDDRITKLWLSDEAGHFFFTLGQEEAPRFLARYLDELKKLQGYACTSACPHATVCRDFLAVETDELPLLPLNKHMAVRLYDGIPAGKSKLRYLVKNLKETIHILLEGNVRQFEKVNAFLNRDCFVEYEDQTIKYLGEWYADPMQKEVLLTESLLHSFQIKKGDLILPIKTLTPSTHFLTQTERGRSRESYSTSIRDWIEGYPVNPELLEPVRTGMAALLHDVSKATWITRPFTSRTGAILQRTSIEHRIRYPLIFEKDLTFPNHILVKKQAEVLEIIDYPQLRPSERAVLFESLAKSECVAEWIYGTEAIKRQWQLEVEEQLGLPLPVFALLFHDGVHRWHQISKSRWAEPLASPFRSDLVELAEQLFADWFLLRDNVVDGDLLHELSGERSLEISFDEWLSRKFAAPAILNRYSFENKALGTLLLDLQQQFLCYKTQLEARMQQVLVTLQTWEPIINLQAPAIHKQLEALFRIPIHPHHLLLLAESITEIYNWCFEHQLEATYHQLYEIHQETQTCFCRWQVNRKKVITTLEKSGEFHFTTCPELQLSWNLEQAQSYRSYWIAQEQLMEHLWQALAKTPRKLFELLQTKEYDKNQPPELLIWNKVSAIMQTALSGEPTDPSSLEIVQQWFTLPIDILVQQWSDSITHKKEQEQLVLLLANDLGWKQSEHTEEQFASLLYADTRIRLRVKNAILNLLKEGKTILPKVQGKGILEEIKQHCPTFYQALQIQLLYPHLQK